MNTPSPKVVLISASPKLKTESALSEYFVSLQEERLRPAGMDVQRIHVRQSIAKDRTGEAFRQMLAADAMLLTFPLYFFCLPGLLMRFLQDFDRYRATNGEEGKRPKIYAVVNCGFPEPDLNEEAIRVVQSFSRKIGADFRFGVLIGGGGMILGAKDAPFMKKTMEELAESFERIKDDIAEGGRAEDIRIALHFPRRLYFLGGNSGWRFTARKNGLKRKDLYRKPYREIR